MFFEKAEIATSFMSDSVDTHVFKDVTVSTLKAAFRLSDSIGGPYFHTVGLHSFLTILRDKEKYRMVRLSEHSGMNGKPT